MTEEIRRRALVVGATSGIGDAIVRRLVSDGRHVVAWGRSQERLEALKSHHGAAVSTHSVDVTDVDAVSAALEGLDAGSGGMSEVPRGPLDVVVWAAGVFDWGPADEADPDRWAHLLDVNLVAAARATPRLLRMLRVTPGSTLVFIGSGAAHRVYADNAAYVASKHGLAALASASFLDVKRRGVRVSMVSPGLVASGAGLLAPQGVENPSALLQPADVADAVAYVIGFPGHGCPVLIELQPLV